MTAPRPSLTTRTIRAVNPLNVGSWLGRTGRAWLGVVVILLDAVLLILDTLHHEPVTMPDAVLHLGMFLGGLALIDREKAADLLRAWKGA